MRVTAKVKEATRARILEAARELFTTHGFAETTTRDLAKAAGVANGTLFNYFTSKEAVAMELVDEALRRGHSSFETGTADAATFDEDLFSYVAAGLRELRPYRSFIRPVLEASLGPIARPPPGADDSAQARHLEAVHGLALQHGRGEFPRWHCSSTGPSTRESSRSGRTTHRRTRKTHSRFSTSRSRCSSLGWGQGVTDQAGPTQRRMARTRGNRTERRVNYRSKENSMQPTIAELMAALPEAPEHEDDASQGELLHLLTEKLSKRPVPVSSLKRFSLLGSLQAKVAVAYFFYWLRSWFGNKEDQKKQLSETHLRAAVQILDSMSYLRGAVMKIGQTLANFPDLVPQELAETLGTLHFEAPPMHYSLIREQLHDELGGDPGISRSPPAPPLRSSLNMLKVLSSTSASSLTLETPIETASKSVRVVPPTRNTSPTRVSAPSAEVSPLASTSLNMLKVLSVASPKPYPVSRCSPLITVISTGLPPPSCKTSPTIRSRPSPLVMSSLNMSKVLSSAVAKPSVGGTPTNLSKT